MLRILDFILPGKAKLKQELQRATEDIEELSAHLIDWEDGELELMSLIQADRKVKSSFDKSVSGILCSIYHEHMAAYLWRKVFGIGDMDVMVIRTRKYLYQYIQKNGRISFYVNDQFLGEFRKDQQLYLNRKRILGGIHVDSSEWWDIHFGGERVGSLVNIHKARHVNPRAFEMRGGISSDAEMVFLAIAFYKIVEITRKEKKLPFR